jgi:hypothetical protein
LIFMFIWQYMRYIMIIIRLMARIICHIEGFGSLGVWVLRFAFFIYCYEIIIVYIFMRLIIILINSSCF